ncbi:glycosyltransferase [Candidatus Woesearchaeota archaeon]|nr:glycosyltransferase [Candidatus Woesearchaeota archaeon]
MSLLTQPKISVIIPAHNEEKYIEKTLESISKQTFSEVETIVVANGCTDKTEEIVKEKVKEYQQEKKNQQKNVRLLSLPKANVSVARNAGALNAQGELLVFLDADTSLEANGLETIHQQFAEKHAVATTLSLPEEKKITYRLALWFKNANLYSKIYKGCSGAFICRKKDFHSVGGYNPQLSVREHRKLTLKLLDKGKYTCIPTYATTSMRRFQQWGISKVAWFWVAQWAKDTFNGNENKKNIENTVYEKVR